MKQKAGVLDTIKRDVASLHGYAEARAELVDCACYSFNFLHVCLEDKRLSSFPHFTSFDTIESDHLPSVTSGQSHRNVRDGYVERVACVNHDEWRCLYSLGTDRIKGELLFIYPSFCCRFPGYAKGIYTF